MNEKMREMVGTGELSEAAYKKLVEVLGRKKEDRYTIIKVRKFKSKYMSTYTILKVRKFSKKRKSHADPEADHEE